MENYTSTPTVSYANVTSKTIHPKKDQAIVINSIDGIMLRDYLLALSNVTKSTSIRFISRIANSRICVYMDCKQTADELVEVVKKIKIKDHLLEIRPLLTKNKRIVLSNVCPIIPHEAIEEKFREMNIKILSPITYMRVGINDPGFSHIMSFRRQLYVSPEDEKRLPESMQINYDDTNYWIYITNESMKCFVCNGTGHLAKYCPQNVSNEDEVSNFPPIEFSKPMSQTKNQVSNNSVHNKGMKRILSDTPSEPSQPEQIQINELIEESPHASDNYTDTDSNYAQEDEKNNKKSMKKKKKTLDNRTEEEVWNDIKNEQKDSDNPQQFPLSLDQFISLLDSTRNKQNIQEIIEDYSHNISKLIDMCLYLHPKLNRSLKNRCSRFARKLQTINLNQIN